MSVTYSWAVNSLQSLPEKAGLPNVVVRVIATITGTAEDGVSTTQLVNVTVGSLDTMGFTPFEALTEAQVIGWIESALGPDLDKLKGDLADRIADLRAVSMAPPWISQP